MSTGLPKEGEITQVIREGTDQDLTVLINKLKKYQMLADGKYLLGMTLIYSGKNPAFGTRALNDAVGMNNHAKANNLRKNYVESINLLSTIKKHLDEQNFNTVTELINRGLKIDMKNYYFRTQLFIILSNMFMQKKNFVKVMKYTMLGLFDQPRNCKLLKLRVKAANQLKKYDACVICMRRYCEIKKDNVKARQMLFDFESKIKNLEKNKTHYQVLNVSAKATRGEIKKAYMKMSKIYHPDKSESELKRKENEEMMMRLNAAKDILFDDKKRRKYDSSLTDEQYSGNGGDENFGSSDDFGFDNSWEDDSKKNASNSWEKKDSNWWGDDNNSQANDNDNDNPWETKEERPKGNDDAFGGGGAFTDSFGNDNEKKNDFFDDVQGDSNDFFGKSDKSNDKEESNDFFGESNENSKKDDSSDFFGGDSGKDDSNDFFGGGNSEKSNKKEEESDFFSGGKENDENTDFFGTGKKEEKKGEKKEEATFFDTDKDGGDFFGSEKKEEKKEGNKPKQASMFLYVNNEEKEWRNIFKNYKHPNDNTSSLPFKKLKEPQKIEEMSKFPKIIIKKSMEELRYEYEW